MNVEDLLREDEGRIVDEAWRAVAALDHYRRDGEASGRRRIAALVRQVVRAVRARDLEPLRAHADRVASERLRKGYDLAELQAAFSAVEDAFARRALARLPGTEAAWALALVNTALAHAKEALARGFTALAPTELRSPLDLTPLFRGDDGVPGRAAEDLVYPV
jgi:hypothetical protein